MMPCVQRAASLIPTSCAGKPCGLQPCFTQLPRDLQGAAVSLPTRSAGSAAIQQ